MWMKACSELYIYIAVVNMLCDTGAPGACTSSETVAARWDDVTEGHDPRLCECWIPQLFCSQPTFDTVKTACTLLVPDGSNQTFS